MRARNGIALFAALTLMAVIGLLVACAISTFSLAERSSRAARSDALLTEAADYGLNTLTSDPDPSFLANLPLGETQTTSVAFPGTPGLQVVASATRLPAGVVWLVSDAVLSGVDQGHRRFNLVVRFPPMGPLPAAAVVSRGNVHIGQDVAFIQDASTDAECGRPASDDIVVAPGSIAVGPGGDTLRAVVRAFAADPSSFYLTPRQVGALDSAGRIVHVRGDTVISGGAFEGVMFVDGSVTISGPFHATGVLVARGRVTAVSGAFSLTGALLAFAPQGVEASVELAGATVSYSPCAVSRAFRLATPPRPVRKRSWAELF